MQDFRKLMVWEKWHQLTLAIYHATESFPQSELYGLTNQMRRSSASVPTNIAEGCGQDSQNKLIRFLHIAMGSASELQYQLILARDLTFLPSSRFEQLDKDLAEVKRMLFGFLRRVQTNEKL